MIQANELRIGNLINYKSEPIPVTMIGRYGVQSDTDEALINAKFSTPDLKGIPLTPDILEKCGLQECSDGNEYRIGLPLGNGTDLVIEVICMETGPYDALISDTTADQTPNLFSYVKPVRYVHQLQNLYFALTGIELTVKL